MAAILDFGNLGTSFCKIDDSIGFTSPKNPLMTPFTTLWDIKWKGYISNQAIGGHLGFMQIRQVAQGCRFGNNS